MQETDITLVGTIDFLRSNVKTVIAFTVVGLFAATGLVVLVTPQYEATAQIQMAKLNLPNVGGNRIELNAEDPSLLLARLQLPSTYTHHAISACQLNDQPQPQEQLASITKAGTARNVPSMVEIRVLRQTESLAGQCVDGIFDMIRQQQAKLIAPLLTDVQRRLSETTARLATNESMLVKMEKTGLSSVAYLATRDENRYLSEEIQALEVTLRGAERNGTRLMAPIYVTSSPVFPKTSVITVAGVLAGLLAGVLFALLRQSLTARVHRT